jgi:hypothetical protein
MGWGLMAKIRQVIWGAQDVVYQPFTMFSSYPDFCRKGKSGSAIGKDGVGRVDTFESISISFRIPKYLSRTLLFKTRFPMFGFLSFLIFTIIAKVQIF